MGMNKLVVNSQTNPLTGFALTTNIVDTINRQVKTSDQHMIRY